MLGLTFVEDSMKSTIRKPALLSVHIGQRAGPAGVDSPLDCDSVSAHVEKYCWDVAHDLPTQLRFRDGAFVWSSLLWSPTSTALHDREC